MKLRSLACGFVLLVLVLGCGDAAEKRLRLSGTATFDGQPIPYGDVTFTPDGAKGNSGPQGIAQIRDGKYDTAGSDGKGFAGGPTIVHVTGLSGPNGKLICEFEYPAALPTSDGTFNIEVPKAGAAKGAATPEI